MQHASWQQVQQRPRRPEQVLPQQPDEQQAGTDQAKYHGSAQRIPIGSLGGVHNHGAVAKSETAAFRVARSATADKRFNCASDVTKLDR